MKPINSRYSSFLPTLAVITLSAPSLFAAIGIWQGAVGGADGFWNDTANTEWIGVTGNAWDATNGPNNVAQFNAGAAGANPGTSGAPVANGIIWNNTSGGVSSGTVKLDGANPFINVTTSGTTSQMFANLTGTNGFTKTGAGQYFLISTVKGITGGFIVNQGLLRLDLNSATTASGVVDSSNTLTLSGSTLEVFGRSGSGNVSSQTLGNLTLNAGGSIIKIDPNGSVSGSTTLNLGTWTKNDGATVYFDLSSANTGTKAVTFTTTPSVSNGIIGAYATINDASTNGNYGFATVSGSNIVRYTGATVLTAALGANSVSSTNYQVAPGNFINATYFNGSSSTQTMNSLDIANGALLGTKNLVINSGGLLFSRADTGQVVRTGSGISITSGTSELVVSVLGTINGSIGARIDGGVTDNGSSVSLIKSGPGTLYMDQGNVNHSYTGNTVVNQGTLQGLTTIPNGAGKGNLVVNSGGTVSLAVASPGGTRTINGLSNSSVVGGLVNNSNQSGTAATTFLNLGNNNATASFSGVITGVSIIKSGTGTQTLSGVNTYAGSTAVNAGLLTIASTGTINGTSAITIGAGNLNYDSATALSQGVSFNSTGGTLSGTGTITPAVTITSGNRQTAGSSVTAANTTAALGKQIFTTGITYSSGSIFEWNLNSTTVGTRGTDYDAINTGSLGGSGATFRVILNGSENFGASFWDTDRTWAGIFKNLAESTASDMSAIFSSFEYQNSAGTVASVTSTQGAFTFVNGGTDLKWTAVPEPTSSVAGLLIAAGLLRRRRRA